MADIYLYVPILIILIIILYRLVVSFTYKQAVRDANSIIEQIKSNRKREGNS